MPKMLKIINLHVSIEGKEIIKVYRVPRFSPYELNEIVKEIVKINSQLEQAGIPVVHMELIQLEDLSLAIRMPFIQGHQPPFVNHERIVRILSAIDRITDGLSDWHREPVEGDFRQRRAQHFVPAPFSRDHRPSPRRH